LLGIHLNYPASVPPEIDRAIRNGDPAAAGLSAAENPAFKANPKRFKPCPSP
jgi:hypothetical protein